MYKVLLVDDEILVREAISKKIAWNELGYELVGDCENGKDAIEFVKNQPVDVVLTDICMPYIDGMGLSKYLSENCPQTAIIIFSGYSDFEYAKQAIQYKVSEYILKPVTAKELSEVLVRIREKLDSKRKEERKIDQLTRVYHNYTKNEAVIISRILSRLVKGTQEVKKSLDELKEFGIEISGSSYRTVVIDIDVYSGLYEVNSEQKKESALMAFVVENISSEIIGEYNAGIAFRDIDNRVCLLLWTNKPKEFRKEIVEICESIQKNVFAAMKLSISMGIGCYVNSLEELSKSYESASEILQYRYAKGTGIMFDCEEEKHKENPLELEPDYRDIASSVRSGEKDVLNDALEHMKHWLKNGYINRRKSIAYLQQVLQLVYETVHETQETFVLPDSVITDITEARNLDQALELTKEYAVSGLNAVQEACQTSGGRQAAQAMEYIKDNYANPELNLNSVCEYLNISTSRFSAIFKEETGKTFLEVLTSIRMEKAKQLLKQTTMKNYEIAEKVGFSDPHYFSIAFKKATGMSPKEYAKGSEA